MIPNTYNKQYCSAKNISQSMNSELDSFIEYDITEEKHQHLTATKVHIIIIIMNKTKQNNISIELKSKSTE